MRPLVRAARPSSSRPSCRSTMLQMTARAEPLPVHVSGKRARSTSRTSQAPHAFDCEKRDATFWCAGRSRYSWPVILMESRNRLRRNRTSLRWRVPTHPRVSHAVLSLALFLGYTSGCPECQARPCSGLFTGSRLRRCCDRRYAHMAIRVPSCGCSDRQRRI
jgi:hypothetical protein